MTSLSFATSPGEPASAGLSAPGDLMSDNTRNERGWDIKSWEGLRIALSKMGPHSKLYKIVQAEMKKRGNWKNAPKGTYPKSK